MYKLVNYFGLDYDIFYVLYPYLVLGHNLEFSSF
jgi:hypothetical protein